MKITQLQSNRSIKKKNAQCTILKDFKKQYQLYLLVLLPVIYLIVFHYIPIYGIQIAFKDFKISKGIWGSEWIGLNHFFKFFDAYAFYSIIVNTISINLYQIIAGFPIPVILALALNNSFSKGAFKKFVQMVTYAPHFISTVVLVGLVVQFFSINGGFINKVIQILGFEPILFLGKPELFSTIYVWSGIWQNAGWGTIIYLAALSGIDKEIHEASIIDGASLFKRVLYIDIPGILPTMTILLILNFGHIMSVGFEKVLLMQNPMNIQASEVISTFVYKVSLAASLPNYSYGTAIGLFNSLINFTLIILVNKIARKFSETSLW